MTYPKRSRIRQTENLPLRRRVARHLHVDGRTLAALVALAQAEECLHLLPRERLALVRVARALGLGAGAGAEVELVGFLVS